MIEPEDSIEKEYELIKEFLKGQFNREPTRLEITKTFAEIFKNKDDAMERGGVTLSYYNFKCIKRGYF